jgi:hypothetical protein
MAWNGTNVALLYDVTSATTGSRNVYLALLNPDGTRAVAQDTALTNHTDGFGAYAGDVKWNGTSWAAVWLEQQRAVMFQTVATNGSAIGSPVNITTLTPGVAANPDWTNARLTYSAANGYALATTVVNDQAVDFQRLGADGIHPQAIIADTVTAGGQPGDIAEGSATTGWAVLTSSPYTIGLELFNPDGSQTTPPISINTFLPFTGEDGAAIVYDGVTWVGGWTETDLGLDAVAVRGPALATKQLVEHSASTDPALGTPRIAASGGSVTFVYDSAVTAQLTPATARLARFQAPSDPNAQLVPLTDPMPLVTTTTVAAYSLHVVATGSTSAMAVWSDTRWGHTEIYVESIDYQGCL